MNEEERRQNFEKLKSFFNSDIRIKNSLLDLAPTEKDNYDEESRIEYIDRLYKELKYMEFEFLKICKNFGGQEDTVKEKLSEIREKIFLI